MISIKENYKKEKERIRGKLRSLGYRPSVGFEDAYEKQLEQIELPKSHQFSDPAYKSEVSIIFNLSVNLSDSMIVQGFEATILLTLHPSFINVKGQKFMRDFFDALIRKYKAKHTGTHHSRYYAMVIEFTEKNLKDLIGILERLEKDILGFRRGVSSKTRGTLKI